MNVIVNHDAEYLHESLGISEERTKQISFYVQNVVKRELKISKMIIKCFDFCQNDNERVYVIWLLSHYCFIDAIENKLRYLEFFD